jgi:hypothetical protein
MPLFLLTTATMIAFAANSVLNRLALAGGSIDAASFGAIRLVAGAVMLAGLCLVLRGRIELRGPGRIAGVLALLVYIYGFSGAYNALDAGIGALILFGVVQITMFAGGLWAREAMPPRRWIGALVAFGGLVWLLWPGAGPVISPLHGLLMALAGVGWGIYSLAGRRRDWPRRDFAGDCLGGADLGGWLCDVVFDPAPDRRKRGGGGTVDGAGDCHGGRHDLSGRGAGLAIRDGDGSGTGRCRDLGPAVWATLERVAFIRIHATCSDVLMSHVRELKTGSHF